MNTISKVLKKNHLSFDRILLGVAGLGLTVTSGYCSVVGFNELFGNAGLVVTILACFLEAGKVAITGFLFTHWGVAKMIQKVYMTVALVALMLISGAGAFGFFQDAFNHSLVKFQNASVETAGTQAQIDDATARIADDASAMTEAQVEIASLRKQVDALPAEYAKSRTLAATRIAPEIAALNAKIDATAKDKATTTDARRALVTGMTTAKLAEASAKLNAGPFMAVATKLGVPVDTLATVFISILVFVFDPLAVSLVGAFAMTGKMMADEKKTKYAKIYRRRMTLRSGKTVNAPASITAPTPVDAPKAARRAKAKPSATASDSTQLTFTSV